RSSRLRRQSSGGGKPARRSPEVASRRPDVDEVSVVRGDRVGSLNAVEVTGDVADELVPPQRATDREACIPGDARALREPMADLRGVRAAAQHDEDHVVAPAAARLLGCELAVLAALEAFDLPDVGLDACRLQLAHRLDDERGPQLCVVPLLRTAEQDELVL